MRFCRKGRPFTDINYPIAETYARHERLEHRFTDFMKTGMVHEADTAWEPLRATAIEAARRARVPYSRTPRAAVVLLGDGTWVPGVRVESASFSLVIPALRNAVTTAVASGRTDIRAVVLDHAAGPEETAYLHGAFPERFIPVAGDAFVDPALEALPALREPLDPFLVDAPPDSAVAGLHLARRIAGRAHAPESHFPVGCVVELRDGRLIPGVNVEHPDWSCILCAERNALGTAVTWGLSAEITSLYLTCLEDRSATPCGACRQMLVELVPTAVLWMDRGSSPPADATPAGLLPGAFSGDALTRPRHS